MADRTELLKKSKQYFESNKEVNAMYATTDGNFFYEKHFADSQAKDLKTDVILITRTEYEEANKPKNAEAPKELTLADLTVKVLKAKCVEAEYAKEEWEKLKKADLVEYMEAKANETPEEETKADGNEDEATDNSTRHSEYEEANKPKNALFHGKETKAFQAWLKDN